MQIEHAVVCMLCDAMQYEDTSKNPYQKVEKGSCGRLGYKEGDQISYIQTRRYMTVFSWLKEHSLDPKSVDVSASVFVQTIFKMTCSLFAERLHGKTILSFGRLRSFWL